MNKYNYEYATSLLSLACAGYFETPRDIEDALFIIGANRYRDRHCLYGNIEYERTVVEKFIKLGFLKEEAGGELVNADYPTEDFLQNNLEEARRIYKANFHWIDLNTADEGDINTGNWDSIGGLTKEQFNNKYLTRDFANNVFRYRWCEKVLDNWEEVVERFV